MKNTKKDSYFDLNDALCVALYQAHRLMNKAYGPHLEKLGLTYTQFLVMVCLWNHRVMSVKEIGSQLDLDTGTLTPLVKRLMNLGYLSKKRSQADERIVLISLTKRGHALKEKAKGLPGDLFQDLNMSMEEFNEIKHKVKLVISKLKQKSKEC